MTLGTLRALAAALNVRPGVLADGEGPGRGEVELSREAMERVARAAVQNTPLSDPREKSAARRLRAVLAPRRSRTAFVPTVVA